MKKFIHLLLLLFFAEATDLRAMKLEINPFTPIEFANTLLAPYDGLTYLNMGGNSNFMESLMSALRKKSFPQLQILNLKGMNSPAQQVKEVCKLCPTLKVLWLHDCPNAISGLVEALKNGYGKQLEGIGFGKERSIAQQVQKICQLCPNLRALSLHCCKDPVLGLVAALENGYGKQLKELDLTLTDFTDDQIYAILAHCLDLKELRLYNSDSLKGFIEALENGYGKQLKKLDLGLTNVTADQVQEILILCPKITELILYCCPKSAEGVLNAMEVGDGFNLEYLDLTFTDATIDQIQAIQKFVPNCIIKSNIDEFLKFMLS